MDTDVIHANIWYGIDLDYYTFLFFNVNIDDACYYTTTPT